MPYFADSDNAGKITAFYNNSINSNIPESAIALTDEEWQDCINNPGKWIVDKETLQLVLAPPIVIEPPTPQPNWAACMQGLLLDIPYNTMINNCTDLVSRNRIEIAFSIALAGKLTEFNLLTTYWNLTLANTPEEFKPNTVGIEGWIAIASNSHLPVNFNELGQMILVD